MKNKFSLIEQKAKVVNLKNQISLPLNFTHALILGQTGSGKTSSAILPIMRDRIEKGHGILAFDYKGVEHAKIKALAKKAGRLGDVYMLNVPWGIRTNLIADCPKQALSRFFSTIFKDDKDNFWSNLSTSTAMRSLNLIKALQNVKKIYQKGKAPRYSLQGLVECTANYEHFVNLIKDARGFIDFYDVILPKYVKGCNISEANILANFSHLKKAKYISKDFLDSYGHYERQGSDSNTERMHNNYAFMLSAIEDVASNAYLNDTSLDSVNISKELREGKIIIVNTDGISNDAVALLASSVLNSLSKKDVCSTNSNVSVFIDEANRVINPATDLCSDVLREARVELVLAAQNQEMLIENLGFEGYKKLVGNMASQFFYKNSQPQFADGKHMDFSNLGEFECYFSGNRYFYEPIFFNQDELMQAELDYQHLCNVSDKFTAGSLGEHEIATYDAKVFDESGCLMAIDIRTGAYRQVLCLVDKDVKEISSLCGVSLRKIKNIIKEHLVS